MNETDRGLFTDPGDARRLRAFLKDTIRKSVDFSRTDQGRGVPPPPVEKPYRNDQLIVGLTPPEGWKTIWSAGTCAVAAYDQEAMDFLLRLDGEDEFVVYLAPVGKVREP